MARPPLDQGIPRFKANEERIDLMTSGGEDVEWTTSEGALVPSVRKWFKDINTMGEGWLAKAEAAALAANKAPQSWADFQIADFLDLLDGATTQFNGLWVRDRNANITGLLSGPGWGPVGVATTDQFGWDKSGTVAVNHSAVTAYLRIYGTVLVTRGTYLHSGEAYNVTNDCLIMNDGFDGGVNLLGMAVSKSIQLVVKTPDTAPVSTKDSRVGFAINITAQGEQHGTGFRADLYNQSTDGQGNTGFYGQAVHAGHWSAALHGENKHGLGSFAWRE